MLERHIESLFLSQYILLTGDKELSIAIGNQLNSCEQFDPQSYDPLTHAHEYEITGRTHIVTLTEAVKGRYVTVYLNDTGSLSLCEVEVCAEPLSSGKSSCAVLGSQAECVCFTTSFFLF